MPLTRQQPLGGASAASPQETVQAYGDRSDWRRCVSHKCPAGERLRHAPETASRERQDLSRECTGPTSTPSRRSFTL